MDILLQIFQKFWKTEAHCVVIGLNTIVIVSEYF